MANDSSDSDEATKSSGSVTADASSPDYYRLASGAACIDAGSLATLWGQPRVVGRRVDIGAVESAP